MLPAWNCYSKVFYLKLLNHTINTDYNVKATEEEAVDYKLSGKASHTHAHTALPAPQEPKPRNVSFLIFPVSVETFYFLVYAFTEVMIL